MDTYIVIHQDSGPFYVVRTTDWLVIATCANGTLATQVKDALEATD